MHNGVVRHWCNTCRSSYSSIADHVAGRHPEWSAEDYADHVRLLDFSGNIPPSAVGYGTINDTAAVAVEAGYISSSRAGRFGGLGYRARRVWPRGKR